MEKRRKVRGDDPNIGKKKKPKGFRTVNFGGTDYFWMTDGYVVIIKSPAKSIELTTSELMGYPRNPMSHEIVTPYDVRNYIEENLSLLG